jgi:hypothetical protein
VKSLPLKSHPRISLSWLHNPSPCFSLDCDMGSPPLCDDTEGGGNMQWMPCSMARENFVRFVDVSWFVSPIKSSTYTSARFVGLFVFWSLNITPPSSSCSRGWVGRL